MSPLSGMKLSKVNFDFLDLPNLLIDIWDYNDQKHTNCPICNSTRSGVLKLQKSIGNLSFFDFDYVISNIRQQNKKLFNFGKISPAHRSRIYRLIWKNRF